jgi:hypothetical protein
LGRDGEPTARCLVDEPHAAASCVSNGAWEDPSTCVAWWFSIQIHSTWS